MKPVILGTSKNKNVSIDLDVLLRTRLLIQANSGGGKSWLLRRLAEQLWGKVQIIIIDPEGEFSTLREKFGFVLVGEGGETPVSSRSAALLAHKLLELRASAVCNIYDGVKPATRHEWVRLFLDALVDSPKKLWHPVVVIVDEAHKFCPERKAGQSEASEAMIRLATDGRKRGFAAVWATQRLAKLNKDASSELLNRLVGPTFEDLDLERAADLLSVPNSEKKSFFLQMKTLEPGNFYALGRAISKERVLLCVGNVSTTHPEAGSGRHAVEPPPPPDKVRAMLPQLKDLPQAAEAKLKTEADLRAEIALLKRQLRERPKEMVQAAPDIKIERVEVPVLKNGQLRQAEKIVAGMAQVLNRLSPALEVLQEGLRKVGAGAEAVAPRQAVITTKVNLPPTFGRVRLPEPKKAMPKAIESGGPLPRGELAVLTACIQFPDGLRREQLTVLTGYKRSSRDAYVARLKEKGFVATHGNIITATEAGRQAAPNIQPLPTGIELQNYWLAILPEGERKILALLLEVYPGGILRDEIDAVTGYKRSSRDAFLSRMAAKQLIEITTRGEVRASADLF